jgi:hypothetical protein
MAMDMLPALYADRIEPTIKFSPTGDVQYSHDFEEATIVPAAQIRHAHQRNSASDDYLTRFMPKAVSTEIDDALPDAIAAEYQVPATAFASFAPALTMLCETHGRGLLAIRLSDLVRQLKSLEPWKKWDFAPLIRRLLLPTRGSWAEIPAGYNRSDVDLGKFDRRLSPIARPIVALSAGNDPELVVAPGLVERAFMHNIAGAAAGALQNEFWQSQEMRVFASSAGAKAGQEFNREVAGRLSVLKVRAWPSVKPSWCLNEKNTPALKELGDVDVLAVSPDLRAVWVIEAKDLKLCRTLGESARRLSSYRGQRDEKGRPDALLRHLRRVEYLRTNAARLLHRLKLPTTPRVHGVLVVNAPQPMQQLHPEYSADSTVVMLDELEKVPWSAGWALSAQE